MHSSLNITALVSPEVAAVEVHGVDVRGLYEDDMKGTGWSKRHPEDLPNEELAFNLAMARALQDLANEYARKAADLAGFPVVVDLTGVAGDDGLEAAVVHYPAPIANTNTVEEKVAY
jgi:hypothetical protein